MPSTREPLVIGPFAGGLNTYDDPTAVRDTELVEALNWDPGLEGSLRSRPPFTNTGKDMTLGNTGNSRYLGFYYATNGTTYLIASDGFNSTWAYNGTTWTLITNTFAASAMVQFDNKAWLLAPVGETDPGGYWVPNTFTPDADMPRGDSIVGFKSRLWVSPGRGNPNGTRVYYSKVLGQPNFWATPSFIDIGQGDGQEIVLLTTYYDTLLVFRSQSIYNFSFTQDPAQGSVRLLVPGIGLATRDCLIAHENYLYFMFDEKAYQFINNNAQQINLKVPFTAVNKANVSPPYAVSLFNNRAIFHYYDTMYVYSLRTRTWTTWKSAVYGAIGQILSPAGVLTDEAYVNPSQNIAPEVVRSNLDLNPRGISTGDLSAFGTRFGWVRSFPTTGAETVPLPYGNVCRLTSAETGTVGGRGFDSYGNMDVTNPGTTGDYVAGSTVTPGQTITISRWVRLGSGGGPATAQILVRFHNGAGAWVSGASTNAPQTLTSTWLRLSLTITVPAGATRFCASVRANNVVATSGTTFLDMTGLLTEVSSVLGTNYDGSYAATADYMYLWAGTVNASISREVKLRKAPLLRIEDRITNQAEEFQCIVQTKNYNYQNSSNFKKLFWWGVDATFRTRIQGWAIPVVQRSTVTWGHLYSTGITWGQLLNGTWGQPLASATDVKTDYNLGGSGPMRKFVKMFQALRFRQIYFRLVFDTDGSLGEAPVNLFTVTAYVGTKETVSKTVS